MSSTPLSGGPQPIGSPLPREERADLRQASHELEAVFIRQLFAAMRSSNTNAGLLEPSPGEEMFTSIMDDRLASEAAEHMKRGLGEALYHQLSRRLAEKDRAEES